MKKRELTVEVWMRENIDAVNSSSEENLERVLNNSDSNPRYAAAVYEVQMAKLWQVSGMQVYDFDPDFTDSIVNEKWTDLLPDCIGMRPHDCFYMKLPCDNGNEGVVVLVVETDRIINFDPSLFPGLLDGKGVYFGGYSLYGARAIVNTGDETLSLCSFPIPKDKDTVMSRGSIYEYPADLVANGVAYLCSTNADIVPSYTPQRNLRRNNAKRRSQAEWHDVGYRIGAELRAYKRAESVRGEHQGGTVRPHMRRAHWHHYWTGPRNGERKLVLRWVAPTMVGIGEIESATRHRVR